MLLVMLADKKYSGTSTMEYYSFFLSY